MDNKTYSAWRDGFLAEQMPYRAVQPQELISTGENTYILNGLELTVKPEICSQIDTFMGGLHTISQNQLRTHSVQTEFVILETTWHYQTTMSVTENLH